jgi:outer membrane lipoprotein-sorting protein
MNDSHEVELSRRLERLTDLKPTIDATRHALDRVREALADAPDSDRLLRKRIVLTRLAAAAVLLAVGGLVALLLPRSMSANSAFADVQAAMKSVRSVTFRQTTRATGQRDETARGMILGNGLWRADESDGSYYIANPAMHGSLYVNPRRREARLMRGVNLPQANLYELTKNMPSDALARALPGKQIDGKDVLGFVVKMRGPDWLTGRPAPDLTVWANAKTRFPVRIEGKETDEKGKTTEVIIDELVFDQPLDPKLFSFEPPAGYSLETQGTNSFPNQPTDPRLKDLVVTPLVGVGPVKFGMSRDEVERLLGKPDGAPITPDQLNYASRGLFIFVSQNKKSGMFSFACVAQKGQLYRVRDFSGRTDKGIALGASAADIIRAYGAPDSKDADEGSTSLSYDKLQTIFQLLDGKLVQMIFNRPRPPK